MLLKLLRKQRNMKCNITEEMKAIGEVEAVVEEEEETDHIPLITNKRHNIKERESIRKIRKRLRVKQVRERIIETTGKERFRIKNPTITSTTMVTDQDQKELKSLKIQKYHPLYLKIKERSNLTLMSSIESLMNYRTKSKPSETKS